MQRFFQLILVLGFTINVFSQIEQGTLTLGGSIYGNGYSAKTEDFEPEKTLSLGISPNIGYLIINNLELRFSPSISYSIYGHKGQDYEFKSNSQSISIGLKAIKYFGTSSFKPFIGLGIHSGVDWTKLESKINLYDPINNISSHNTSTTKDKTSNTQASIDLGFAYFLNESISINTSINYNHSVFKSILEQESQDDKESKTKINGVYFRIGFGIFF
jgi:outer membrane protein W